MDKINEALHELMQRLIVAQVSNPVLVQAKAKTALANIKRARTLIEKAELTARWAERELAKHNKTLVDLARENKL